MDDNGRFGFDPEDFEHVIRDATEGLRDVFEGVGRFFTCPVSGPDGRRYSRTWAGAPGPGRNHRRGR